MRLVLEMATGVGSATSVLAAKSTPTDHRNVPTTNVSGFMEKVTKVFDQTSRTL
jgi:hypothetical protein